jgi:undecaprenyl-diphosphatase
MMRIISESATLPIFLLITIICIIFFTVKRMSFIYSAALLINLIGSGLSAFLLKFVFRRQRPEFDKIAEAVGFSFPSAHSTVGLAFYGLLTYYIYININSKKNRFLIILVSISYIFLIGTSRIYLGVHYVSDVFAGYILGMIWLFMTICCFKINLLTKT